ncbi:MAG TPA: gamma-glutamyltransferase [Lacipirellula sp.]
MTDFPCSRREFLQRGPAALASTGALGVLHAGNWSRVAAREAVGKQPRQAVACSRPEAAEAAREILEQGGNAMDAAVAALAVLCVIEPGMVSLGGYGGSLVYYQAKTGAVHAIDFDGRAPRRFNPATFSAAVSYHGYLALTTPGIVAGIELALQQFGSRPFKTLANRARQLAQDGFEVTPRIAASFRRLLKSIDPASRRAFFPNGVPGEGESWSSADLARLIEQLSDERPQSFYHGTIPSTIVRQVQASGGILAEDDFESFEALAVEPLHIKYREYDLYTPPLPSGGLTSLSILKTLEQFDLPGLEPWGADYVELFAGASNLAWQERFKYFGDPEFVSTPVEKLLSEERAVERAERIRTGIIAGSTQPDGTSHTVNIVVVDREQNTVSLTATHGADYGSHVAIGGLGLMLGHGMSRFSTTAGDPNYPAPRKRPQHNMSPLVVLKDGKPFAALGLPGGRFIVTVTAQMAVSLLDFQATAKQIVTAPRLHTEGAEPILVTQSMDQEVVADLRQRGRKVDVKPSLGSAANAIVIDPQTGVDAAASQGPAGVLVF